jgi:hypothetical protein
VLLQCYYSVVTVVSQCCYSVVAVVLQCCYSGVTVVSQCCYSVVKVLSQWCYSVVTVLLQWCHSVGYSVVTVLLQCCYSGCYRHALGCGAGVVTVLLQCCYSVVTVGVTATLLAVVRSRQEVNSSTIFHLSVQSCFSARRMIRAKSARYLCRDGVTKVLQRCHKSVAKV